MSIDIQVKKGNGAIEIDKALKKLKRIMTSEGILKELKERQYYTKPSERRRKKSAQARSRVAKENRMKDRGIM